MKWFNIFKKDKYIEYNCSTLRTINGIIKVLNELENEYIFPWIWRYSKGNYPYSLFIHKKKSKRCSFKTDVPDRYIIGLKYYNKIILIKDQTKDLLINSFECDRLREFDKINEYDDPNLQTTLRLFLKELILFLVNQDETPVNLQENFKDYIKYSSARNVTKIESFFYS